MATDKLETDEKSFTRNLGYPKCSNDINGGDPFKSDVNGFSRNSVAHNAYKIIMNVEHGQEDSFRAALVAVENQSYCKSSVDLFVCPNCGLCFVHPKRFLIHFKWHSLGLGNGDWCINGVTSVNTDFLVKKMVYYCFCSETFFSIKELGDHVKKRHGLPKSSRRNSSCKKKIDLNPRKKNPKKARDYLKKEKNVVRPRKEKKLKCITKKIENMDETQVYPDKAQKIMKTKSQLKKSKCPKVETEEKRCASPELHQNYEQAEKQNEMEEQKCSLLEKYLKFIGNLTVGSCALSERDQKHTRKVRNNITEEQKRAKSERERARRHQAYQNETDEQRRARLERKRICSHRVYQNETDEKRRARLERERTRRHQAYQNETDEQRRARLERNGIRRHRACQNETDEQRRARLERKRLKRRKIYQNETEEQKCARLEKYRMHNIIRKQNETEQQRFARLERERIRRHLGHQNETDEQRRARLEVYHLKTRKIYQNETEEQKCARLEKYRKRYYIRKQNETEQQKFARLERDRIHRLKLKNKTNGEAVVAEGENN